jgi:hypothetical protein
MITVSESMTLYNVTVSLTAGGIFVFITKY